jgi:phosphoglycerate dehydrogenase-like enzyme
MSVPRIAVEPHKHAFAVEAVLAGGGSVVEVSDAPEALVWLGTDDYSALADQLAGRPEIRWVQLPMAGVERVAELGLFHDGRLWTCAKGAYAESVAEHVLTLALAGLRHLPERLSASSWGEPAGTTLYEQSITILGAGGITSALLQLLAPFRVEATVVRRRSEPLPGASRTVHHQAS